MLLVDILLTLWLRLPLRSRFFYCEKLKANCKNNLKNTACIPGQGGVKYRCEAFLPTNNYA